MNAQKFTQKSIESIQEAQSFATRMQSNQMEQIHLLHALLTLGVSLCFFPYQEAAFTAADFGYLMASLAFEMLVYLAISAIVAFICVFAKNMGLCILCYLAVALGSSIIGAIFQVAAAFADPTAKVTYGIIEFFGNTNIYTSTLIGAGSTYGAKEILYLLLTPIVITALCTLLGWRVFEKKDLK